MAPSLFDLHKENSSPNGFMDNSHTAALLTSRSCAIIVPTGSQIVVNRRALPEGRPNLVSRQCGNVKNLLVFTASDLGPSFYLPPNQSAVSFYQLEGDTFFPGKSFSGFGRYALFRIIGSSSTVRLQLSLTNTFLRSRSVKLPPAAVVGAVRGASLFYRSRFRACVFCAHPTADHRPATIRFAGHGPGGLVS